VPPHPVWSKLIIILTLSLLDLQKSPVMTDFYLILSIMNLTGVPFLNFGTPIKSNLSLSLLKGE
jgi:hypothetical protein